VKEKKQSQQILSRSKWSIARKKVEQEKTRGRVRKYRERCKTGDGEEQKTPMKVFNSAQALGKALIRVTRALPNSPRRKRAVVKCLVHHFGNAPTATVTSCRNRGIGKDAEDKDPVIL